MTPTIRIRYQDEYGAEFYYRGSRFLVGREGKRIIGTNVMYSTAWLYYVSCGSVKQAIKELIEMSN